MMQYSTLGNTGVVVSRFAFGALTFTTGNRALPGIAKVGAALADEMVGRALDAGINFFDTADRYSDGEAETLLGAALRDRRYDVVITTKVGGRSGPSVHQAGLSRRHIMWSVDQSLKRLGTDWIDGYIVHREDPYTPLEETLSALDAVVRSGKVCFLGFSNWSAWRVAAAMEIQRANNLAPFSHGQVCYSLLSRDIESDVIPMIQHFDLGLSAWGPLASGLLTGKYSPDAANDPHSRHADMPFLPFDRELAVRVVAHMRGIAEAHEATVAQVALAWLLAQRPVTSILLGASKMSQLEDNLGAAGLTLSDTEIAELAAATTPPRRYPDWMIEIGKDKLVADLLAAR
jgi:aryl-alcohol dehydrogenase-like predicted oxidoreductase